MEWHVVLLESIYGLGTDVRATLIYSVIGGVQEISGECKSNCDYRGS